MKGSTTSPGAATTAAQNQIRQTPPDETPAGQPADQHNAEGSGAGSYSGSGSTPVEPGNEIGKAQQDAENRGEGRTNSAAGQSPFSGQMRDLLLRAEDERNGKLEEIPNAPTVRSPDDFQLTGDIQLKLLFDPKLGALARDFEKGYPGLSKRVELRIGTNGGISLYDKETGQYLGDLRQNTDGSMSLDHTMPGGTTKSFDLRALDLLIGLSGKLYSWDNIFNHQPLLPITTTPSDSSGASRPFVDGFKKGFSQAFFDNMEFYGGTLSGIGGYFSSQFQTFKGALWDWNENDWLEIASNPFGLVDGVIIPVGKGVRSAGAGALAAGDMAAKAAAALGPLINEVMSLDADTWQKLYEGRFNEVQDQLDPVLLNVFIHVYDLMATIRASMSGMSAEDIERKMGEIFGGLVYDTLEDMAIGAATAGAGVVATRSEKIQNLIKKLGKIPGLDSPAVKKAIDSFVTAMSRLGNTKVCFVAGTPVHTSEGVKPIEKLQRGDLVLTRPEGSDHEDRRVMYKPVIDTIVTHPTDLIHLEYRSDDGRRERISTTLVHPFYVVGRKEFVNAGEVVVGDTLSLPEGRTAIVCSTTLETASEGATFTTYNIEVAETHTYFVGNLGAWVHNDSELECQKLMAMVDNGLRNGTTSPGDAISKIEKELKKRVASGEVKPDDATKHFTDALDGLGIDRPATIPDFSAKGVIEGKAPIHHIATNKNFLSTLWGGPWSPKFKDIFDKAGINLNDAINKVAIPGHKGPHPEAYHRLVYDRLLAATKGLNGDAYKKALMDELDAIAEEAVTPGSIINKMLTKRD